jgi:electron transfer flavoprotein beta subunit
LEIVSTTEPTERAAGVIVADVAELVAKLKDEAGVI